MLDYETGVPGIMDYGSLISQAWNITWRYRFLWLLGLLAGGAVGMPSLNGGNTGWQPNSRDMQQVSPDLAAAGAALEQWSLANIGLLIGVAALGVLLALTLLVLSFIAQGGMARATADLATGHTSSLGRAWSAGLHLFWRYVGLWVVLLAAGIIIAAILGAVIAAVALVAVAGGAPGVGLAIGALAVAAIVVGFVVFVVQTVGATSVPRWLIVLGATLFALPLFTVLAVIALGLSIVVAFAQRAIAIENVGPIDALRSGWHLARAHLGESLLTWLINVGLAIATALTALLGIGGALVLLGGMGWALFSVAGFTAPTIAYIGIGGLAVLALLLTVAGIANAFFWTYWTLAYLRLSRHDGEEMTPASA
jgi:hypothetical protein